MLTRSEHRVMAAHRRNLQSWAVMVYANDAPPPGMFFAIMYHPRGTSNSLTSPYTDPLSMNPWYKGTHVGIHKFERTIPDLLRTTSFQPNNKFT